MGGGLPNAGTGLPLSKAVDAPGQFTGMFGTPGSAGAPPAASGFGAPAPSNFGTPMANQAPPKSPVFPPAASDPPTPNFPSSAGNTPQSGATQAFSAPKFSAPGGPGAGQPAPGPSEYTRMFAAPKGPGALEVGGGAAPPAPGGGFNLADLQMPQTPQMPQMPQAPQMPYVPGMPQMQSPQMPQMPQAPQMPQMPQLPSVQVTAPKSNLVPILLFVGLLVIAIAVVLVFALRK